MCFSIRKSECSHHAPRDDTPQAFFAEALSREGRFAGKSQLFRVMNRDFHPSAAPKNSNFWHVAWRR
jgi:hypothetical protein